jgi:hypothetical protein
VKEEGMVLSAVAPNVVRTGISSSAFYDKMEEEGLLTPMESVLEAFKDILEGDGSGVVYECGPKGGVVVRRGAEYLDEESGKCCELLLERGRGLH